MHLNRHHLCAQWCFGDTESYWQRQRSFFPQNRNHRNLSLHSPLCPDKRHISSFFPPNPLLHSPFSAHSIASPEPCLPPSSTPLLTSSLPTFSTLSPPTPTRRSTPTFSVTIPRKLESHGAQTVSAVSHPTKKECRRRMAK